MNTTSQEKFWQSDFGQNYTKRNLYIEPAVLDDFYKKRLGISRSEMNKIFLRGLKINNILEAGCNTGSQLILLQKQGFPLQISRFLSVASAANYFAISRGILLK